MRNSPDEPANPTPAGHLAAARDLAVVAGRYLMASAFLYTFAAYNGYQAAVDIKFSGDPALNVVFGTAAAIGATALLRAGWHYRGESIQMAYEAGQESILHPPSNDAS